MVPVAPPPPRSSTTKPATAKFPAPAAPTPPLSAVLPTPPLSRPSTPLGGRPGKPAPTLSVPALLNDIGVLLASAGVLEGKEFRPDLSAEEAYAPRRTVEADDVLERLRKGELQQDELDRETAVRLAEEWTGEMDRLLKRAEEGADVAAKGDAGKERRAERVQAWAADVGKALVAA
ncbi:hypothetical protein NBRC10513v2_006877 [Rhodotorula toruloides]|uniref:Uncharacterized protein n=1 Tax=Rhodotorula toruloides TaxID=5286 RepID=A0A0K3CL06_RHOTO